MAREKRRNSDKRKEKSRDAARCRRGKEMEIFTELADCLPLTESVSHQLDKASVMRLAISQLKIDDVLNTVGIADDQDWINGDMYEKKQNGDRHLIKAENMMRSCGITNGKDLMESHLPEGHTSHLYLKAMEGTVVILSSDGDLVYLSDNVAKYLGLQQIELMGQSIYDYIHPCDHDEIRNALNTKSGDQPKQQENGDASSPMAYSEIRTFSIRMKCTLTTKGRSINLKSAPYKVMKCSSRLVTNSDNKTDGQSCSPKPYLLAMMEPIPHPSNIEVPLDSSTFLSKHEMDTSFIFCDDRIEELAGYDPTAMVGHSFFDFPHALDSEDIRKTFKDLYSKGQAMTSAYRMLVANGGFIWVVTQATTINNSRNQKPQSIVCVHYILSGVQEKGVILSNIQQELALPTTPADATSMTHTKSPKLEILSPAPAPIPAFITTSSDEDDNNDVIIDEQQQLLQMDILPPKLELSTESIFSPKTTEDTKKILCRPPDLVPYVTSDPDNLSCLSPVASDDMPLPFTTTKMTDSSLSLDLTSPMLPMPSPPEINRHNGLLSPGQFSGGTLSTECSRTTSPDNYFSCDLQLDMDPVPKFFAPVDENPGGSGNGIDTGFASTNNIQTLIVDNGNNTDTTKQEVKEKFVNEDLMDIDFAMRAPYIPMDGGQDLDLLPPSLNTLFDLSNDDINPSVYGRTEFVFGPKEALFEEPKPLPKRSLRDMLGESTVVASIEQPLETEYLQMKRPLDMNCLEKGPPAHKQARLEQAADSVSVSTAAKQQPCRRVGATDGRTKNSVLLNLLLTGEDTSYGYRVSQKPINANSSIKTNVGETNRFSSLTRQDWEVNAPIQSGKLLQGQELFNALDL